MSKKKSEDYINFPSPHQIDIIGSSNVLKKLYIQRCQDLKRDAYYIAQISTGLSQTIIEKNYLGTPYPRINEVFTQEHVIKMLRFVGIFPKISFELKPLEEIDVQEDIAKKILSMKVEKYNKKKVVNGKRKN